MLRNGVKTTGEAMQRTRHLWRAVLPGKSSGGTSTHTHRHVTCVLDMSAVAIPALQVYPDFIQEDFPNPNNIPLKVTPVQIFIAQIISPPSFPSFTKR